MARPSSFHLESRRFPVKVLDIRLPRREKRGREKARKRGVAQRERERERERETERHSLESNAVPRKAERIASYKIKGDRLTAVNVRGLLSRVCMH